MCKEQLSKFNIDTVLEELSKRRPLFHNERDFQFELAWQIKELYECEIRLEYYYKTNENNKRCYIDLFTYSKDYCIAFELKYKTKSIKDNIVIRNEYFDLKNQSARDLGSASVCADLCRLQKLITNKAKIGKRVINKGYVVFLTNDENYKKGFRPGTMFADFGLTHESYIPSKKKVLGFNLNGKDISKTSAAQFENTDFDFEDKSYYIKWNDYNKRNNNSHLFKLIFEINE